MRTFLRASLAIAVTAGFASTALAGDFDLDFNAMQPLGYNGMPLKAPPPPVPYYSWTGFYGGVYSGGTLSETPVNNINPTTTPDPTYNTLANGGVVGVPNAILPGGVNCNGLTNCTGGGNATTSVTPAINQGYTTPTMLPASRSATDLAGLYGVEIGMREQFENHYVLGIGADISGLSRGNQTTYASTGSFYNSNGFTGNSAATGCIYSSGNGVCAQAQSLNTSGSVITVNSGAYTTNLAINANPNWIGTVRGQLGYAFDRLMIFTTGGLAYADGKMNVSGTYADKASSACSGVSNIYAAAANNSGQPGQSFVNYSCNNTAANSASVNQTTISNLTYSGSHGGILTGFATGSGVSYAITDHVSLNVEGIYYNLGTVRATVTGSGTSTTTTTTTGIAPPGGITTTATTAALTSTPFTVSKVIDGVMVKAGLQYKF